MIFNPIERVVFLFVTLCFLINSWKLLEDHFEASQFEMHDPILDNNHDSISENNTTINTDGPTLSPIELELQKVKQELRKEKESNTNLVNNPSGIFNEDQISFLTKKPGSGRGMTDYLQNTAN